MLQCPTGMAADRRRSPPPLEREHEICDLDDLQVTISPYIIAFKEGRIFELSLSLSIRFIGKEIYIPLIVESSTIQSNV
jgi:hypothetical protein